MKKNILKIAFVVAIAMVSGINLFNAQKSNVLSDIALANVEALAEGEIDMRMGYMLVEKTSTCSVCEWTGNASDYCNVYDQLPDCY